MFLFIYFYFMIIRMPKDKNETKLINADDIHAAGVMLTAADFDSALSEARASYSDSIGAPKVNKTK